MSKRLTLVLLAAAVVAFIATPAFAAVQNVKVSGDLEVMPLTRAAFDLKTQRDSSNDNREHAILSFLRLRVDADLTDNVSVTARLLNERDWDTEASAGAADNSDLDLDLASVTLKEFLYSPLTLTIGRQELHMGSEMVVGDPDTNNAAVGLLNAAGTNQQDLSKRKSFDAFRATLDYSPLVIDAIYAKIAEANHYDKDDITLWGFDANYDLGDDWDSLLEAYAYQQYREEGSFGTVVDKNDHTNVFGARVITNPIENLVVSLEGAIQTGKYNTDTANKPIADRKASAIETGVTYSWPNARYTPTLTGLYAMFSGEGNNYDSAGDDEYNDWNPMYENQAYGDIANALLGSTNIHVVGVVGTANLAEDINVKASYYLYQWDKPFVIGDTLANTAHESGVNLLMEDDKVAGQELDLDLTYDYTEDVQIGMKLGAFFPGESFQGQNDSVATQAIGSMAVSF